MTPDTTYSRDRGCGWLQGAHLIGLNQPDKDYRAEVTPFNRKGLNRYRARNQRTTWLDPFTRDVIEGTGSATFRLDCPNGDYKVLIVSGHPIREHKHPVFDFDVLLEDERVGAMRKSYPGILYEDRIYDVAVRDGALNVTFASDRIDKTFAVAGMLIFPRRDTARHVEEVERIRKSLYYLPQDTLLSWTDVTPEPAGGRERRPATEQEKRSRCMLYSRGIHAPLMPEDVPLAGEALEKLSGRGAPGEYVSMTLGVYALEFLHNVRVKASDLACGGETISAADVDIRLVAPTGNVAGVVQKRVYNRFPDSLRPLDFPLTAFKDQTTALWLIVHIPPGAKPGRYRGAMLLSSDDAGALELPLQVDVLPVKLLPSALFVQLDQYNLWYSPGVSKEAQVALDRAYEGSLRDLVSHGVDSVNASNFWYIPQASKTVSLNTARAATQTMAGYRKIGHRPKYAYFQIQGMLRELVRKIHPEQVKNFVKRIPRPYHLSDRFWAELDNVLAKIRQSADKLGLDEIVFCIHDESATKPELRFVREVGGHTRRHVPRSWVYGNVRGETYMREFFREPPEKPHVDMWWVYGEITDETRERVAARGVRLLGGIGVGGEPEAARFAAGLKMWRLRLSGGRDWAYNSYYGSASTGMDGPDWGGDACFIYPTEPLSSRIKYEMTREGLTDYRYLRTLEARIRDRKGHPAAGRAKAYLARLARSIDPAERGGGPARPQADAVRRKVTEFLLALE